MPDPGEPALPDPYPVEAARHPLRGSIAVPGSKSLTNRALLLAAFAAGESTLLGALRADDTERLAAALEALGVPSALDEQGLRVRGAGGRLRTGDGGSGGAGITVNLGDGGTPARFLLAAAAFADGPVTIDGSASLRERPFGDGVALLRALGVEARHLAGDGLLPVRVEPGTRPPQGGTLRVGRTASSQFVSALLLVAPWMERGLAVEFTEPPTSQAYLELTIEELRRWGVQVQAQRSADGALARVHVPAGPPAARAQVAIEADASSALYWAVAAAIVPGSRLELAGLPGDSSQPDMGALRALSAMGARVEFATDAVRVEWCQQRGGAPLHGAELDASGFPDGALALAAAAAVAGGPTTLRGLGTLRVKESDRLAAMEAELGRVGCEARVEGEALVVDPPPLLAPRGACVHTYRDHRIAMSFAVLALRTGGIQVADPACVGKSYPGFWRDLERLRSRIG